jgi:HAD superfamily phosphoserine phosphatase-like hydrolase
MSKLILFDFDGTLTKKDSFPLFIRFSCGSVNYLIGFSIHSFSILLYKLGIISGEKLKQSVMSWFFKGSSENELRKNGSSFIDFLLENHFFNPSILQALINEVESGNTVAVVSASPDIWIKPFCDKFKVKCISTKLKFENETFTGLFETANCAGIEKARRIRSVYDLSEFKEIIAYGNSKDDLEMLGLAQIKNWINAKGEITNT